MKSGQMGFDLDAPPLAEEAVSKEPQVFSVSELNRLIRGELEGRFRQIWVRGEISNFKAHTSGHHYFSLKDEGSQINAVMFKGFNSKLKFRPESGLEVVIKGKITVYEPRGNYQIFCEWMEPVGAGALQKAFEQLKAKLAQEGLFDSQKKRPLPAYPKHIGVVTSPTGAAIQDILNVLRRRYKGAQITLAPTLVQGPGAAEQIVKAINLINQVKNIDVLIIGRGGGSMEDLWPFNEEVVARAIAASRIPTISAVGHEVDFTIADFVADLRAPTPSAAAELVVKNASDLADRISRDGQRLQQAMSFKISQLKERLRAESKRLTDPRRRLQDLIIRCDEVSARLESATLRFLTDCRSRVDMGLQRMGTPRAFIESLKQKVELLTQGLRSEMRSRIQDHKSALRELMAKLEAFSPLKVVERGYAIVTDANSNKVVKEAHALKKGDQINVQFAKGQALAEILEIKK